jgi:outer membrane protein OmpA-like peptidoglycan-associated protein
MTLKNVFMIAALSGALALGGCVTDPETGDRRISRPAGTAAAGAGAGALLGALLGGRNNRAEVLIGAGVGAIAGGAVGSYMDKQARELKQRTAGSGIEVEQRGDEIAIKLPSGIAFDTNESNVRPDMRPALDQVAKTLASYQSTFIDVTGHTDSTGGDAINQPLSDRRASAVADYLQYQGVQRARMATRGYGAQMPVATNDTDAGRAQNRRVEIRLSPVTQSDVARPNS